MSRGVNLPSGKIGYAYHRQWFADTQARVAAGEPFALVAAEAPLEILRAMDIPFVTVQWWSSIVSAKRKAPQYLEELRKRDLPDDQDQYFALGLASTFDTDPESAPWGGLPRPSIIIGDPRDDNQHKIYELWARETGAIYYPFERAIQDGGPDAWWELGPRRWDELIDPALLDLHVEESKGLIRLLEQTTGKRFCETRFREVLDLVNETEEWFVRARDLVSTTRPAPIGVSDTFTSVMMPQWHRGTVWARDAAKMFHDEVAARVAAGDAACPDEKLRLAWLGQGLWFNVDFYESFMDSHKAVFVWSMYLGYAADAYLRYGDEDPLRTLSARYAVFTQYMSMEPWPSGWFVKEAKLAGIDGVVVLGQAWPFLDDAFADAGIPLLRLDVHQVDNRKWSEERVQGAVRSFLDTLPKR
ncbi:MAG: 2-hydroxyacyl-CoA dehydratase [Sphingomonadales bacterium]|nr:MAG: 2-hydroxyacyl-CoA dehydratase [Sphingomonadales bacterium]